MPMEKDFKRIVRARMATTGEPYTAARAALECGTQRDQPPSTTRPQRWLDQLGSVDQAMGAFALLKSLSNDELRPVAVAGLRHANWRVRRSCARLLDDLALTDESWAGLQACLTDEHPKVRRAALHTLSCEHCKPEGCVLDVRGVLDRMAEDPNHAVRKMVVGALWRNDEQWSLDLLTRVATADRSPQLRAIAQYELSGLEAAIRSNADRERLPADLRAKTERHTGKWVAIADGRIVAAERSMHGTRRAARKQGWPDADLYWVKPEGGR